MIDIVFTGPDSAFLTRAIDSLEDGEPEVQESGPTGFTLLSGGGSVTTRFTGEGLMPADATSFPFEGTITGARFSQDGATVADVTGAAWPIFDFFVALVSYLDNDGSGLDSLFALQDIRFDATAAVAGFSMRDLGLSFSTEIDATGSRFRDDLYGGTADDTVRAGGGNDRVDGLAGDDAIQGGGGKDNLKGGTGKDTVDGGGKRDRIDGGKGQDDIAGGSGNDILKGGTHDDTIRGNAGKDRIVGGDGDDDLAGQGGADSFLYDPRRDEGADTIRGFDPGADTLVVTGGSAADVEILRRDGGDSTLVRLASGTDIFLDGTAFGTFAASDIDFG